MQAIVMCVLDNVTNLHPIVYLYPQTGQCSITNCSYVPPSRVDYTVSHKDAMLFFGCRSDQVRRKCMLLSHETAMALLAEFGKEQKHP